MTKSKFKISLFLLIFTLFVASPSLAATTEGTVVKQYDGLWFLGFNMHKDIFSDRNGPAVRKAFNMAIDRDWIVGNVVKDNITPSGAIPPGMLGYDKDLKGYQFDLSGAKALMKAAGYPPSDQRLKKLTLLHTDGDKTVEIAKWIKRYLINLGVDLQLVQVKFSDNDSWARELRSGKYHMFLMGYKATIFNQILIGDTGTKLFHTTDCAGIPSAEVQEFFGSYDEAISYGYMPDPACKPQRKSDPDAFTLLEPLFHSQGDVNFTFYTNARVDSLLDQMLEIDGQLISTRVAKLKEINKLLLDDPPTVNIFYITKL